MSANSVLVRVLDPIDAERGRIRIDLGGPRQRAVLAMLLCARPALTPVDRLIDGVWGDRPPATATTTLRGYVSRLRRLFEPARASGPSTVLVGGSAGYALRLPDDAVDASRFELALRRARQLGTTDPVRASALVGAGLDLWRGPAYSDVAEQPWAAGESLRLDELRVTARELAVGLTQRAGRAADAASAAHALTCEHPLREQGGCSPSRCGPITGRPTRSPRCAAVAPCSPRRSASIPDRSSSPSSRTSLPSGSMRSTAG